MDSSFAITGKGYVIVAADMTASRSIVKMQTNVDKVKILGSHLLMAYSGEPGKHNLLVSYGNFTLTRFVRTINWKHRRYRPIRRIRRA